MKPGLDALLVFDRLEVGPPVIAPNRLSTRYRVVRRDGTDASTELVFRWEEPVFDLDDPSSANLAALVAAQVALNYGLFCKRLVFHGPFDAADRRLLEDMARNTAREIYVNKFLRDNPFLVGAAAGLEPDKRDDYLRARIEFADDEAPASPWPHMNGGHAVLSSGGKDSLLSLGLLRELDHEPWAIFVNEAGRHWHTALNAYRHLRETWPRTARVWTNCDRVFSWMLRHLPFVRPDFAEVRADIYPVRLWTVAVFLFAALPLMRKRGIDRLVIGDEYDTSTRVRHHGITHYDGLYDQSRWFDQALSRYYRRKRWGVRQFSLLRPLSELLILRVLVERYPELQSHQVSCHATHVEGDVVRPCGRCEKCRRIVGMLTAIDADPARCGYSAAQIEACLTALRTEGLKQEEAGSSHLRRVLIERGVLPADPRGLPPEHPEIASLRFDREHSPIGDLPVDLRRPLYGLLLHHARGSVRREGRVWVPFDVLRDPDMERPDPQETRTRAGARRARRRTNDYLLGELTWPEAEARFRETDLALLPVGAVEQHGPHLPLDIDAWDADYLARRVAAACSAPRPLVLPPIPYGVSYHHEDFAGTISVTPETLARLVYEVGISVARHGITKLVMINGHGGNVPTLQFAAQNINRDAHIFTCVESGETSDADIAKIAPTPGDVHAGEIETSTALATRPELVSMDLAEAFVPRFSSQYLEFSSERGVDWFARTSRISPSGVLGDPTQATRDKGERIWQVMIKNLVEFVEALKGMTLDEIYERRY